MIIKEPPEKPMSPEETIDFVATHFIDEKNPRAAEIITGTRSASCFYRLKNCRGEKSACAIGVLIPESWGKEPATLMAGSLGVSDQEVNEYTVDQFLNEADMNASNMLQNLYDQGLTDAANTLLPITSASSDLLTALQNAHDGSSRFVLGEQSVDFIADVIGFRGDTVQKSLDARFAEVAEAFSVPYRRRFNEKD